MQWEFILFFQCNYVHREKAYNLYDTYIDEGHSLEELMQEINGLLEASGFFKKGQA